MPQSGIDSSALSELTAKIRNGPRSPTPSLDFKSVSHLVLTIVVLAAGIGGYVVHKRYTLDKKNREEATRRTQFEERMSRFAAPYNAVRDWQEALAEKSKAGKVYNAELAPLIVRADGRPIVVIATLQNVTATDGKNIVYFAEDANFPEKLMLRLESTPEQARKLMSYPESQNYAVIAQIQSLDYILTGDYSLAVGRCVDVLPVSFEEWDLIVEGSPAFLKIMR